MTFGGALPGTAGRSPSARRTHAGRANGDRIGSIRCTDGAPAAEPSVSAEGGFTYFSTDLGTIPYDQALLVLALQGIVNREGARLYVNTRTLSPWWLGNPYAFRNEWDERWLDVYGSRGYVYEKKTEIADLLTTFHPYVRGLVIHDPNEGNAGRWIAMTIAGVEDRLPVTPEVLSSVRQLSVLWPDRLDLRGSMGDKIGAYQWAIDTYLHQCSEKMAYVIGHDFSGGDPGDIAALDYGVSRRAFIFDLMLNKSSSPGEAQLSEVIARHLSAPAALWGWHSEWTFCDFASRSGNYAVNGVCASNLSFHRHMAPVSSEPLKQTTRQALGELALDASKYYLAVVYSDGDIAKHLTRFFAGDWLDPARGQVPMNWAINPALCEEFPALFEYFYLNATENDYFVAGSSGAGYSHPSVMPNADDYAAFAAECKARCDIKETVISEYDIRGVSREFWNGFLATTGIEAVIHHEPWIREVFFQGDHVPFIPSTFLWRWYNWGKGQPQPPPAEVARDIERTMIEVPPPAFAVVYGDVTQQPGYAKQVMDMLDPERFVFLRLDEMNALARQIGRFQDVGVKHWAHEEIEACFKAGIAEGCSETRYGPTLAVTRDEMAVWVARALAGGEADVPEGPGEEAFPDVPSNARAHKYVAYAVDKQVAAGYRDGRYHPELEVDRAQMAVFVARAMCDPIGDKGLASYTPPTEPTFPDVPRSFWAYRYIEYIADPERQVVCGYEDGCYHPELVVTRDQMAVYIGRAFGLAG